MRVIQLPARRGLRVAVAGVVAAAALTACGGSGSSSTTAAATPSGSGTGGPGGRGFNSAEFQKIRECLTAAGISIPTPTGTRSFNPSDRPTDRPSRTPGATRSGGGGFGGGIYADPKVRAALEACGITLPTGRPSGSPGATGAPTSTG